MKYAYFGESQFELSGERIVVSAIRFDKGSKIKLFSGEIVFDNSMTLEQLARLYPKAVAKRTELLLDTMEKVISVQLATSREISDDVWLLFFKAGKLVRMDHSMPC